MRKALIAAIALAASTGALPQTSAPHNYEAREGMDYAYSAALSSDARAAGQLAPQVMMFRYAGERDGRHQVHSRDAVSFVALECAKPCQVVKVMTFIDQDLLRKTVAVQRFKYEQGSLAHAVFEDVFNGQLHQYGMGRGNKRYQVWVDDQQGYRELPLKVAAKPALPDECLKRYDLTKADGGELPRSERCKKLNP